MENGQVAATEQVVAVTKRLTKDLGFPRDADFESKIRDAVVKSLETGKPQKIEHPRERSHFDITIARGQNKYSSKVYINDFTVTNRDGSATLRFPTGGSQPTMKAMENASNGSWILLNQYQPKDEAKKPNDVWFRLNNDGSKQFVSANDFDLKPGKEILGYKLTDDDVKQMQRGNNVLTNDCMKYEKGSNVPVGKNENTVSLYADPPGNRVGYKDLGQTLELKKNMNNNQVPPKKRKRTPVNVTKATKGATAANDKDNKPNKPRKPRGG